MYVHCMLLTNIFLSPLKKPKNKENTKKKETFGDVSEYTFQDMTCGCPEMGVHLTRNKRKL